LRITDLTGRTLEEKVLDANVGENKYSVDVSNYPTGIYQIRLMMVSNIIIKKLIVK
jgi:hypothetical protein